MVLPNSNGISGIRTYTKTDLIDFIAGSTLLAVGGGGAEQIALNMLDNSGIASVNTVTVDNIDNSISSAMVAQVFAPSALWKFQNYNSALRSFKKNVGQGLVFPGETGAVNGIVPAIVAALTDSLLLTAATSDRSLPEMDMTLFQNVVDLGKVDIIGPDGLPECCKDFADDRNALNAENFILSTMSTYEKVFQGVGGFAAYPLTGMQIKEVAAAGLFFENAFDYSLLLGQVMREQGTLDAILATIGLYLGGKYSPYTLFKGYFVDTGLHPEAQDYECIDFRSADPDSAMGLRIYSSNENMIAFATLWIMLQGAMTAIELFPVAIGPDGIGYLLLEGVSSKGYKAGFSFTNEAFDSTYGDPDFFRTHQTAVLGIPEPRLRRPDIIASFTREITRAMNSFDRTYTYSYVPIEDLPKLTPQFDIRKDSEKQKEKIRLHIRQSDEDTFHWLHNGKRCRSPQCILDHHELIGSRLSFTGRRQNEFSEILTFPWPEIA